MQASHSSALSPADSEVAATGTDADCKDPGRFQASACGARSKEGKNHVQLFFYPILCEPVRSVRSRIAAGGVVVCDRHDGGGR